MPTGYFVLPRRSWTQQEIQFLKEYYKTKKDTEIADLINRTERAVFSKRIVLGLTRRKWGKDEIEVLKKHFPDFEKISKILNRSLKAVCLKSCRLGLRLEKWTEEKVQKLKEVYATLPRNELIKIFPSRSWSSIYSYANKLELKRDPTVRSKELSLALKGKPKPYLKGKPKPEGFGQKISLARRGMRFSEEHRTNISRTRKRLKIKPWNKDPKTEDEQKRVEEYREKMRRKWLERLSNPEQRKKLFRQRPSKPELKFTEICKKYRLPYRFTGDGSFWIEDVNPDFVESNGRKIAVEVFGDYWHNPLLNPKLNRRRTYKGRKEILARYGWKCVIFWESELMSNNAEELVLKRIGI